MSHRFFARLIVSACTIAAAVVCGQPAQAAPACVDKPNMSERIAKVWRDRAGAKGPLGCALGHETDVPDHDGRRVQFLRGQVVWSPAQKMLIVASESTWPHTGATFVDLEWWIEDRAFSYDFFIVRPVAEGDDEEMIDERQKDVEGTTASAGRYRLEEGGHFVIVIEGCDRRGFPKTTECPQGWSNPVEIDAGYLDLSRTSTTYDRLLVALTRTCSGPLDDELNEDTAFAALAKLDAANIPEIARTCAGAPEAKTTDEASRRLRQQVSEWLRHRETNGNVGTGVKTAEGGALGVPAGIAGGAAVGGLPGAVVGGALGLASGLGACRRTGNYDFALTSLVPIAYDHRAALAPEVYRHLLDELLDQRGGADEVSESVSRCGFKFPETENHVMMTEAARYLTNQLLLKRAAEEHDPNTSAFAKADREYNNERNGMNEWMLKHLQGFLKNDFHEYNSKPYQRLTVKALQNLAAYADPESPNKRVALAATMVLHHLAGRFAVSSSALRKAPPFRRQGELRDMPELYGRHSDGESWRFLLLTGVTSALERERLGRAHWIAHSTMAHPRLKFGTKTMRYQLPPLVADLIVNDRNRTFWQGIRHEGVEINAASPDFLIAGGGRWEPRTTRDMLWGTKILKAFASKPEDTHGNAMPTTLMPTAYGDNLTELIRISGDSDREKRNNTCVAPGFACGLNPTVPDALLRRFPPQQRPCRFPVAGEIALQWRRQRSEHGPLGCPTERERGLAGSRARIQDFERGQIVWSPPQQMAVSAYYTPGRDAITVDWNVAREFTYDFFIIRWDKDATNIAQRDRKSDDPGASETSGQWTFPLAGQGVYTIVVEGCEERALRSSKCEQKWTHPVTLEYPSKGSCARGNGDWIFVNLSGECNPAGPGPGLFVARYSGACAKGSRCDDQRFGFFEARKVTCRAGSGGFDTVKPPRDEPEPAEGEDDGSGPFAPAEQLVLDTLDGCQDFQSFISDVLKRNGRTKFTARGANDYRMPGRVITFEPNHSRETTGILRVDGKAPKVPARIADWGVEAGRPLGDGLLGATGDIVSADGRGCVVIRNASLGQSLVLDMRDWRSPATRVEKNGALTCKDVPPAARPIR
jgi:hypothetical protein